MISCLDPNDSVISKVDTKYYCNVLPMKTFKYILTTWEKFSLFHVEI